MPIVRLAGIPLRLHWSTVAVLGGYAGFTFLADGAGAVVAVAAAVAILMVSIVLHELGHALAARRYGIETAHITLYPFGGVAALRNHPRGPREELVIALAGPLVNGVLAGIAVPLAIATGWFPFVAVAVINVVMGVFNLIPAFPMDGGRVFRAVLTPLLGFFAASRVAIGLGLAFAVVFLVLGVCMGWPGLALVGIFLLVATRMERKRLGAAIAAARSRWSRPGPWTVRSWAIAPRGDRS